MAIAPVDGGAERPAARGGEGGDGHVAGRDALGGADRRELSGDRAADGQIFRDEQFTARQRDDAGDGKVDGVAGGNGLDGLTQRAGSAIIRFGDGDGGGDLAQPP